MKRMETAAGSPQHPDPGVRAFLERRFLANSPGMLIGMGTELLAAPDRTPELAATGIPLLVACGENDDAWPVDVQRAMAEHLGAPFHVIEGAAHSPAAEKPTATAELLAEFWSQNS
jgi:pimeloyl-ACP methyl ester carboxylesterase